MSDQFDNWKSSYIPDAKLGEVETELATKPFLRFPIYTVDDIDGDSFLYQVSITVASCIKAITGEFPDGPTYFALSSSEAPSALIAKFKDYQCIVISHSTIRLCHKFAKTLFQDDDMKNFVISGREVVDRLEPTTRTRKEAVSFILSGDLGDDNQALEWADLFVFFSSYFIVAHEIGHLACDHFSGRNSLSISESDGAPDDELIARRADEWQADSFAAIATIYQHIRLLEGKSTPLDPRFPDRLSAYRFSIVLIYCVFTIMDLNNKSDVDYSRNSHPAPLARAGLTAVSLMISSSYTTTLNQPQAHELVRSAFKAVEVCIGRFGSGMLTAEDIERYGGEAADSLIIFTDYISCTGGKRDLSRWSGLSWTKYLV